MGNLDSVEVTSAARLRVDDWLYEVAWQPAGTPAEEPSVWQGTRWLLLLDERGVGRRVGELIRQAGGSPVLVEVGDEFGRLGDDHFRVRPCLEDDWRDLLEAVQRSDPGLTGAIHLWGLDSPLPEPPDDAHRDRMVELGSGSVLSMLKVLATSRFSTTPRLWIVTQPCASSAHRPTRWSS